GAPTLRHPVERKFAGAVSGAVGEPALSRSRRNVDDVAVAPSDEMFGRLPCNHHCSEDVRRPYPEEFVAAKLDQWTEGSEAGVVYQYVVVAVLLDHGVNHSEYVVFLADVGDDRQRAEELR